MRDPRAEQQERSAALQQALSQLGNGDGGAYTPEALADLARRAGSIDPGSLASVGRALGMNSASASGLGTTPQHVLFRIGATECAFPSEVVQGVERISDITSVPNTAPWVLGVVQVWGAIVSAIDLQILMGQAPQSVTSRSRLVVVTRRDMTIGLLVETVTEMRPLGEDAAGRANPRDVPTILAPYAVGSLPVDDRSVVLLDADRLLFSEKLKRYQAEF